jgi:signal peptidase I
MSNEVMLPTIEVGSYVDIDKSPDFFTYGDIVAYDYNGTMKIDGWYDLELNGPFIARIVGLPGDSLAIENDFCIINGKRNPYKLIRKGTKNKHIDSKEDVVEYIEILPNGVVVGIYKYYVENKLAGYDYSTFEGEKQNMAAIKIPENHYFLLADFRNNSIDSRDTGAIPKDKIRGKVVKIKPPKK